MFVVYLLIGVLCAAHYTWIRCANRMVSEVVMLGVLVFWPVYVIFNMLEGVDKHNRQL